MSLDEDPATWPHVPGYRLQRLLGEGASGAVFLATREGAREPVALKVLASELLDDEVARARFAREASLLEEADHPALLPLLEAAPEAPRPYLALAYLSGGDLRSHLAEAGPLPGAEVLELGRRLAGALGALHRAGIVHRDLKPENVLLDGEGRAYLADLGLGKGEDSVSVTRLGQVMGSLAYMAPEVLRGQQPGPGADLYSLAVLLLEAATGFRRRATVAGLEIPREVAAQVQPRGLLAALRSCLRGRPEDRPASAEELATQLAEAG